ncbi:hypothetical protein B0H65DRAFT_442879 [Neurospora tetraspora]|uniref:Cellobiose dehydrogenase-like cytochrome domain-containing protein n=1 Tax=Neurospora tetraspora TaxID=94610 RepID=A0AAE0JG39_9PEZI|nr:hypothetical protein B0H65DRAFT_442879 [Neurospora tetraspora]
MRLSQLAATLLALLGNAAFAKPVVVQSRDTVHVAAKYCDASTSICYSEFISPEKIAYRFAIPDNATAGNFDVLLQIVAPKAVGWAGLAWGGVMVNNPLLVAWPYQSSVIASSRKASARTYPQVSNDVSYKVLAGSGANATHWTLNALAKGASAWGTTKLDPNSSAVPFAYAQSRSPPTNPADVASRFSIHQTDGYVKMVIKRRATLEHSVAELVSCRSIPWFGRRQ